MPTQKKILTEPKIVLYPVNRDLARKWFTQITTPSGKVLKLYGRLNLLPSVKEREAYFAKLKAAIFADPEKYIPDTREKGVLNLGYEDGTLTGVISPALSAHLTNLRAKSASTYKVKWRRFKRWCKLNYIAPASLTFQQADLFLKYLQSCTNRRGIFLSPTTVNSYRNTLKTIYALHLKHSTKRNPFANTKKLQENRQGFVFFKPAQVAQIKDIMQAQHPQIWLCCQFQYYCFIRPGSELLNMRVKHIDMELGTIVVPGSNAKNKKDMHVLIPDAFATELLKLNLHQYNPDDYVIGKYGTPNPLRHRRDLYSKTHNAILRGLGYGKRYSFYSWKHTGVVSLYKSGAGLLEIQRQLRHHDLRTVQIYLESMGIMECENIKRFPSL